MTAPTVDKSFQIFDLFMRHAFVSRVHWKKQCEHAFIGDKQYTKTADETANTIIASLTIILVVTAAFLAAP